ncbi:hypothetical protein GWI33_009681 [Rhynchophorus ferrugineus]|uniref:Uncharacterized protein n=1 Tax=Rhynchophorus ferrugineus TaxID=354439 RepID=A0A834IBU5_RHYFE|nr:hypothetical protein GWI33_009681 [Rhynchophorus ferrugineus]
MKRSMATTERSITLYALKYELYTKSLERIRRKFAKSNLGGVNYGYRGTTSAGGIYFQASAGEMDTPSHVLLTYAQSGKRREGVTGSKTVESNVALANQELRSKERYYKYDEGQQ